MKIIVKYNSKLLDYLINNTDYKKTKIKSLFKYKNIYLNNKNIISLDIDIKKNDIIEIKKDINNIKINNINIVYEDKNLLVVNKPSGMLTIATNKEKERTLYHQVREYVNKKHEKIFIVHRLDKDTSGIVLFSKSEKLKNELQEKWNELAITREYHAVLKGILTKNGVLKNYLKENKLNYVYISNDSTGKYAETIYEVINTDKNTLVKINIKTGRKNQIRVQFNNIGYPILGDKVYGKLKGKKLLLCATKLEIINPIDKKKYSFEINIPKEYYKNLSI